MLLHLQQITKFLINQHVLTYVLDHLVNKKSMANTKTLIKMEASVYTTVLMITPEASKRTLKASSVLYHTEIGVTIIKMEN